MHKKVIGEKYLKRWYLIPRNRWFNIYLHKFEGSDEDRALHDHPWDSISFLLWGELIEILEETPEHKEFCLIPWLKPVMRKATHKHRMILCSDDAWTLFLTGPKKREWGFFTETGWVPWREFLNEETDVVG